MNSIENTIESDWAIEEKKEGEEEIKYPNKIIDKLYLGNMFDSMEKEKLIKLNIKHILVCGNELPCRFEKVLNILKNIFYSPT
jgi:hypothetical protein